MPRKVFTAGEVLAAADVNSFLMDQTVMSFAGTAARGSAISSPAEGMVTYLEDSDTIAIYEGSAWKQSLGATGGIIQVVTATTSTGVANSTTTFTDTGLTATLTPKSLTSTILVLISQNGVARSAGNSGNGTNLRLVFPDSTTETFAIVVGLTNTTLLNIDSVNHLSSYSHNSLSAQTFKTQFANQVAAAAVTVQNNSTISRMILLEVAA